MKNNVIALHPLRLVLLPGSGVPGEAMESYAAAYETWKIVWRQTLLELDGSDQLFSDHFTRQDYILAIFHGPLCVALCCFRRADLKTPGSINDSWFKPWSQDALISFAKNNSRGIAVSWLTIHPDYRRTVSDEHIKDFSASNRLCEQINLFMQDCKMELAFGITRNNRSVNKMSEYVGFSVFQHGANHHGVEVDLITVNHDQLREAQKSYPQEAFEMWNNRTVYQMQTIELFSQSAPAQPRLKMVS